MPHAANNMKSKLGFSLLELMAVVAIIAVIATLIIPRVTTSTATAKEKACFHNRAEINSAVEIYAVQTGSFPADISDLDTPDRFPDGIPVCPVSGVPYTLNATTHRVEGHLGGGKSGGHP